MSATTTKDVGIPTLRFSGFDDTWKSSTLGEVTSYTKGFAFKSKDYRKSGVRIVRVSDLAARLIKKDNNNVYVEESRSEEFSNWIIRKNEIVITTVGSRPDLIESAVGRGIFVDRDGEGLLNQNMLKIESENGNEPRFIFSQINTPRYTNYIAQIKRGNANQANITVKDLMAYRIVISSIPEQQKIADFLTAVDGRIKQLIQKKALLEDYKKGVMQQLFSQTIRFKDDDGNDFPDWEEKKIEDIALVTSGGTPSRQKNSYWHGDIPWVTTTLINFNRINTTNEYITQEGLMNSSAKIFQAETILIALYGQGKTRGRVSILGFDAATNQACGAMILDRKIAHPIFVFYDLQRNYEDIRNLSNDGGQKNLSGGLLKKIKIKMPSLNEQIKIANFLSAIDLKIGSATTQITQTQTFKRGLLQQMFL
jgi:type I restriction enzyme S subunit